MKSCLSGRARWLRPAPLAVVLFASQVLSLGSPTAARAEGPDIEILRIEEDWELKVGDPDSERHAPQVTTILSPGGALTATYFAFDLNCASMPEFSPGGMQTQLWNGDDLVSHQHEFDCGRTLLTHLGEEMRQAAGRADFDVADDGTVVKL